MPALLAQHAQEISPWLIVAAAAVVVLVALLLGSALLRRRTPPASPPAASDSQPVSSSHQRSIERDMKNLMHELSEMTRRATAQLDARAAKLEQLIHQADQRLAKLGAMPASSNGDENSTPSPAPTHTTIADATSDDILDPRHVEIYTLCEQGLSPQQIADRLHRPSGEVELIIALRPRQQRALGASRD